MEMLDEAGVVDRDARDVTIAGERNLPADAVQHGAYAAALGCRACNSTARHAAGKKSEQLHEADFSADLHVGSTCRLYMSSRHAEVNPRQTKILG